MARAGEKPLLKGQVQNGQRQSGLCEGMAKKNNTTLPKQVQQPYDFKMSLSEIILFLYQSRGVISEEPVTQKGT